MAFSRLACPIVVLCGVLGCVGDSTVLPDSGAPDSSVTKDAGPDVTDSGPTASVTVAIDPALPVVRQGASLNATVTYTRNGVTGPLSLTASGMPSGVTVNVTPVGDGTSTAQMTIQAAANAQVGGATITLKGTNVTDFTFTLVVQGAAGTLDTSFNSSGILLDATSSTASFLSALALPDASVIVVGSASTSGGWLIRRYAADGTLDATFGTNAAPIAPSSGSARAVVADPKNGRVVIVGTAGSGQLAVVRLTSAGKPDTSFNSNGMQMISLIDYGGGGTQGNGAYVLPDSSIVVAGVANGGPNGIFVHYLEDGTRDTTLGYEDPGGGLVAILPYGQSEIFAAGSANPPNPSVPALVRYFTNGSADTTFGSGGRATYTQTMCGIISATLTSTGDVYMVGGFPGTPSFCEVRVKANGTYAWDAGGFVPGGQMGGATTGPNDTVYDDGWYGGSQQRQGFIRRRLATGALDTTFGTTGEIDFTDTINVPNSYTIMFKGITTTVDGRVVAVGQRTGASTPGPVIYRLWP